jgi:hypothetical protein
VSNVVLLAYKLYLSVCLNSCKPGLHRRKYPHSNFY